MKKQLNFKLWGSLGLIILISMGIVSAFVENNGITYSTVIGGYPTTNGYFIYANSTVYITEIGISPIGNPTKCYLRNQAGVILTSGTIPSNKSCPLTPTNLIKGSTYIIDADNSGSTYNSAYFTLTGSWNLTGTYIYWIRGETDNATDNNGYNIANITIFPTYLNNVNLISPTNNSVFPENSKIFTANYLLTSLNNITNATYYVWNQSETIINQTTILVGLNNQTNLLIPINSLGNYSWNVLACGINSSSGTQCYLGDSNYTFQRNKFGINSVSYNSVSYETSREQFIINISYDNNTVINIDANLNYNNANYSTNKISYGNTFILSSFIDIPLSTTSNNFSWILTLYNSTSSSQEISSIYTQTINSIHLENCNATYTVSTLNFSAYKENDSLRISPFSFSGSFNYWLGSGSSYKTINFANTSDSVSFCISPINKTFYSTATIDYESTGYLARDYYLSNSTLINITNNISLYLLDTAGATTFIERVLDTGRNPISNAIIYIQRCSASSCYTVQMAKTDINGETVGFYKTETVDYQHIIIKNGQLIYTDSPHKIFGLSVPYTNEFFVGNASVLNFNPNNIPNLYSTLTFNNDTKQVSYLYIDTSGLFQNGRLFVEYSNLSGTNGLICNVTSFSSSANLFCDLSTYPEGTYDAIGYITRTVEQVADYITFTINGVGSDMGNYGLFLGMLIIITAGMAFLYHPVAGVWGVTLAMIFTNIVHLTKFTGIWIFGVIFLAILFTWLFKD